jgi:hypothetical protein
MPNFYHKYIENDRNIINAWDDIVGSFHHIGWFIVRTILEIYLEYFLLQWLRRGGHTTKIDHHPCAQTWLANSCRRNLCLAQT